MEIEIVKVSEKGQIVIPSSLRTEMKIERSDQFLVFGEENTIVLKKIEKPAIKKSLSELTKPLQKVVSEEGFTREDLKKTIKEMRK